MNKRIRGVFQVAGVILFALLLWRAFPIVVAFIEGAALNIRRFWWLILLIVLSAWVSWVLKKRNTY